LIPSGETLNAATATAKRKGTTEDTSALVIDGSPTVANGVATFRLKAGAGAALGSHVIEVEGTTDAASKYEGEILLVIAPRAPVGYVTKQPDEVFMVGINFDPDIRGSETIQSAVAASWKKSDPSEITTSDLLTGTQISGTSVYASMKAGQTGDNLTKHLITIRATTDTPNTYEATIEVEVAET
jgi:hypothetical protein